MRGRFRIILKLATASAVAVPAYYVVSTQRKLKNDLSPTPLRIFSAFPKADKPLFRAVVIGSGCAGVATAYELAKQGYQVVVIDKSNGVANECSAVSAGSIQKSQSVVNRSKWNTVLRNLFSSTGDNRFFFIDFFSVCLNPHFFRWFIHFSYYSLFEPENLKDKQNEMLKFTDWAIDELEEVMRENNNELAESCGYGKRGTIFLHYETEKPEKMPNCVEQTEVIKYEEALKLEPTLQHLVQKPVWATYEVNSATGDSERFTKALAKKCKAMGVQFLFNTTVQSLETRSQRIKSVRTNRGKIPVSQNTEVIVAAGTWTPKICATIDLFVPIFGLKGYSIAVDNVKSCEAPKLTVVSDHFYITRLGDQLRCSSMGEFSETANTIKPRVDRLFRNMGKLLYPNLSHLIDGNSTRTGLRPLSADGIPLLGRVGRFRNLSVNVGPGFSGWKNSVGAAKLLVQEIKHPEYSTYNFNPSTFFPDNRIVHSSVWSKLSLAWWGCS